MFGKEHWLTDREQTEFCEALLHFGLIKMDNNRQLPLKGGGKTDIYINLRDARSRSRAIAYLADTFAHPLQRLRADRFIEVPDSVSCIAGPLSLKTGLPYMTIREQEKDGRVTKGKIIGEYRPGEEVPIFDDVITDGQSKIVPYREGRQLGLDIQNLVVAVDREQGWETLFAKEGIGLNVWSGMTLHRVRKYLVTNGWLERCEKQQEVNNPLIIALDGKEWGEILPIIDQLRTTGVIFKVNDLAIEHGLQIVDELSVYGRVMLDIKAHDIPNTVENIMRRVCKRAPWAVTIHGSGDVAMIAKAVEQLRSVGTMVLVVTVLTSFDEERCEIVYNRRPAEEVHKLALLAQNGSADGIVCSPDEVAELRSLYPEMTLVTPGVRSPGKDRGDQKRVSTPRAALDRGANYIVGGRQFIEAEDSAAEVMRVLNEELA